MSDAAGAAGAAEDQDGHAAESEKKAEKPAQKYLEDSILVGLDVLLNEVLRVFQIQFLGDNVLLNQMVPATHKRYDYSTDRRGRGLNAYANASA